MPPPRQSASHATVSDHVVFFLKRRHFCTNMVKYGTIKKRLLNHRRRRQTKTSFFHQQNFIIFAVFPYVEKLWYGRLFYTPLYSFKVGLGRISGHFQYSVSGRILN